jgi:hypothetical protein
MMVLCGVGEAWTADPKLAEQDHREEQVGVYHLISYILKNLIYFKILFVYVVC